MSRLHQAEARTRMYPEDRDPRAERRFSRELIASERLDYGSREAALEACTCELCSPADPSPGDIDYIRTFPSVLVRVA